MVGQVDVGNMDDELLDPSGDGKYARKFWPYLAVCIYFLTGSNGTWGCVSLTFSYYHGVRRPALGEPSLGKK